MTPTNTTARRRHFDWLLRLAVLAICLLPLCAPQAQARRKPTKPEPAAARPHLAPADQARFDAVFYRAVTLHQAGETDQAFVLFRRALELDSLSAPTLFTLSADYYGMGDFPVALALAQMAQAIDTANYWYNREVAILLCAIDRDEEAIPIYRRMARISPTKSDPLYDLAELYLQLDSLEECVRIVDRIEELDGPDAQLSMQRFRILQRLGRSDEAFAGFDRLIRRYPYDLSHRILKGDMQMRAGLFAEAKQTYDAAAAIEPDNAYLWVALSNYYSVMGDRTAADTLVEAALVNDRLDVGTKIDILTEYLKTTLRRVAQEKQRTHDSSDIRLPGVDTLFLTVATMHPTEPEIYVLHSDYLSAIGRDTAACQQMRFAVDLKPADQDYWTKFLSLAGGVDSLRLLTYCSEAERSIPESYVPHMFRAFALGQQQRHAEAAAAMAEAVKRVPPEETNLRSRLWGYLGDTYHQQAVETVAAASDGGGTKEAARRQAATLMEQTYQAYDEALRYNPQNYLVLNNYAYFLSLEKRDLYRAEGMAAKVVKQYPESDTYLDTYAWIYFQQGNYTLAKFYQQQALQKAGATPSAALLEHYGDILMMDGQADAAIEQWKKALDRPDCEHPDLLGRKIAEGRYIEAPVDWK